MTVLQSLLWFLVTFAILVAFHEWGHFIVARVCGMKVRTFSIGMGKRLCGFRRGGTDYRISLFPLGGFVDIEGFDEFERQGGGCDRQKTPRYPRWKKILVLIAGPLANILLAFIFFTVVFMGSGDMVALRGRSSEIGFVKDGSGAAQAGFLPGDEILKINGKKVHTWMEAIAFIGVAPGRELVFKVLRGDQELEIRASPVELPEEKVGHLDIYPVTKIRIEKIEAVSGAKNPLKEGDIVEMVNGVVVLSVNGFVETVQTSADKTLLFTVLRGDKRYELRAVPAGVSGVGKLGIHLGVAIDGKPLPFLEAVSAAGGELEVLTKLTFRVIGQIFTGEVEAKRALSGPVGIAAASGKVAKGGMFYLFWFFGAVSLSLGILNFFPIPILDGGHTTILLVESVLRRDFSRKTKIFLEQVGLALLVGLMLFGLYADLYRLF